jgi:putative transposase
LPDHLHAVWSLPQGDADFPLRWSLIKSGFSGFPATCSAAPARLPETMPTWSAKTWSAMSTTFTSIP